MVNRTERIETLEDRIKSLGARLDKQERGINDPL